MGRGNKKQEAPESSSPSPEHMSPAPIQWEVGKLAKCWEESSVLRAIGRESKSLTRWPSAKQKGIASMHAISMNGDSLFSLANRWCPFSNVAKSPPIPLLRAEALC